MCHSAGASIIGLLPLRLWNSDGMKPVVKILKPGLPCPSDKVAKKKCLEVIQQEKAKRKQLIQENFAGPTPMLAQDGSLVATVAIFARAQTPIYV